MLRSFLNLLFESFHGKDCLQGQLGAQAPADLESSCCASLPLDEHRMPKRGNGTQEGKALDVMSLTMWASPTEQSSCSARRDTRAWAPPTCELSLVTSSTGQEASCVQSSAGAREQGFPSWDVSRLGGSTLQVWRLIHSWPLLGRATAP